MLYLLVVIVTMFTEVAGQPIVPNEFNHQMRKPSHVAACMMFQNDGRYLQEWLEYHKSIGVGHFYLYDNASTDDFWDVLKPYVAKGDVDLFHVCKESSNVGEHNTLQELVYNHAVTLAAHCNEWLAIIDSDEFICMPHHRDLAKFLDSYMYATSLAVNWVLYGSSGIEEISDSDLQIDRFVYRAPDEYGGHNFVKSIVRPQYVVRAGIHDCIMHPDMTVFANHVRFSHTIKHVPPTQDIRINHYWWRDEKYFRERKLPRRVIWGTNYSPHEIASLRQIYNSVFDDSMVPFVDEVRSRISKVNSVFVADD